MDRLTIKALEGAYAARCTQSKIWERLAAYEDTGLTPDEVAGLQRELEAAEDALNEYLYDTRNG